jgi:hypothetical protein
MRLARQRLAEEAEAGLGLTHAATLQCKDALRAAAVALTPDPGAEALQRAAEHARAARQAFRGGARGSIKARAAERTTTPPSDLSRAYLDAAAISDAMADRYLIPKEAGEATGPFGATAQTKQAYENLSRFAAAIDVPLRVEDLPPELENGQVAGIIKGGYFPDENSILVSPSSLTEDPQSVDTLLEELAHAIQIGPGGRCNPWKSRGLAYEDRPEEVAAKTSTLVALLEAGLPFETQYGHRIDPRTVRLDVERMRGDMDPRMLRIVNETAGVLVAAIRGDVAGAARRARTCLSV